MNCRAAVSVVLLVLLALQILPCSYQEDPTAASSGTGSLTCRFEPLQVCDSGDSFLGALANIPVLVPGAPALFLTTEISGLIPDGAAFAPDGFKPAIDHPPQLSA